MKKARHRSRSGTSLWRISLLVLLLFCLTAGVAGIYFYARFTRLIDARLRFQPSQKTAVYARPFRIRVEQALDPRALKERLDRIGYHQLETVPARPPGTDWYRLAQPSRQETEIHLAHAGAAGKLEEFLISFQAGRVRSIRRSGQETDQASLKPGFLSNLYGASREKKRHIPFEDLPENLVNAVLAAEDERFFSHAGMDVLALLRAGIVNVWKQGRLQGGSTLTQQFVKNYFLTPEKSFRRKLEEIFIALLLERRLSKKEIFELYANEVYLGQVGSFAVLGFAQGAETYFGKSVKDLSLAQCAFLAGIIQAPNRYSPYRNAQAAQERRNYVLDLMEQKGFISTRENALARSQPVKVVPPHRYQYAEAPYFLDWIKDILDRRLPKWEQDLESLSVYSTLDPDLQKAAFDAVEKGMAEVDRRLARKQHSSPPQVALLAVEPQSGEVLALTGGRNYARSPYNRAVRALRQPGSTFKPFVYAAALEKSLDEFSPHPYTLASQFIDQPRTFYYEGKRYSPRNYGDRYHGPVTLRQALALSLNVVTVQLAEEIGFDSVVGAFEETGARNDLQPYPSVALGTFEVTPLELTQAYLPFATGGLAFPLRAIRTYERNAVPASWPAGESRRVLHPEVAFLMTSALESVLNDGTGAAVRKLGFTLPAAGKTGSSDDSWFIGYTPELLCGVWVGFDESQPLHLSGAQAALPIWTYFMLNAQKAGYLSGQSFPVPENIVTVEIDPRSGLRASRGCEEHRSEYYIRGTEPLLTCSADEERYPLRKVEAAEEVGKPGFWRRLWRIFKP